MYYQLLKPLIELANDKGISGEKLLAGSSLSPQQLRVGETVDEDSYNALCCRAAELTEEASLGLELGCRLGINTMGVVGQALMSCKNLEQSLEVMFTYLRIVAPSARLGFRKEAGHCILSYEVPEHSSISPHFFTEAFAASIQVSTRFLLNGPIPEAEQHFDFPATDHGLVFADIFSVPVHYNSKESAIYFPREALTLPISTASPAAAEIYRSQCELQLRELGMNARYVDKITARLQNYSEQFPGAAEMAAILNTSERSLRRHLSSEKSSYQKLLDDVRTKLACNFLKDTDLSIAEIGNKVGIEDIANFRRTFRRWTGLTPREWRSTNSCNKSNPSRMLQ